MNNLAHEIGFVPPAGWPAMSRAECRDRLTAPGERFEMETIDIRGVPTRVWKHAPTNMRQVAMAARTHGDRLFAIYEDERVTYEAWFRAVARMAAELRERGVAKGDRVALAMRNLPEWPVAFFAATTIGAICVPLNAWWTGPELAFGLANSGAKLLVCDAERWERIAPHRGELPDLEHALVSRSDAPLEGAEQLEDLLGTPKDYAALPSAELPQVDIDPEDEATIFYTSGTTGQPKGALGTHRNLCTNIMSSAYNGAIAFLRRGEEPPAPVQKVGLTVIPLFHVTACSAGLMGYVVAGHTMVFMHKWDPVKAFQLIEREKVNLTGGVPTIAWQLLEHPERANYDLSSLEAVAYGGAPAAPELVRKIHEEFGALPANGWGMTETMATVTGHSSEDYLNRPDSCGPPVAVADLKIVGDDGVTELPVGEVGELWARGPMVVKGYWNRPEATAETFVDGWVRTGDLARLDEEGWCYIVDRAKDMIIRGGENIYSSEVENVLYDHPAVTDAALVAIAHPTLGEEPAAVVHLAPGMSATEDELREWVAARLAKFKVPVRIAFVQDTLPRNANGKILKKDLGAFFA
ncbi:MAG TPA: fatty acid--CoA ligase [Erythrobacter sp.]|jgi:acyl-CoA synthetase (AMP-forming)/AMP-acid ligase II|uniref:class I adenylate-forming enzyme family protein n=1 Tax=Erythrobacteraceae TaxID=335929 RepID=UPI0007B93F6F|nr:MULTISPECIES: class I adenylate-forming enzyme family protein [unclassified Erythrobacter]KZX90667.1 fatty acid--CoA ligase [Erythrobacter sp. HI0019]KZY00922.1 fatty acid--CoA ligase [Erythrobacter sp. HI0028]MDP7326084.1 class I adenylate-forming enzyme family protein [Qipengyuania citrea]HCJ22739.1 fatty acid--CoA ligase [Erythrobacter sp.]|tara:strand:+ start:1301 stop:3037 length:1737 start_codon:yes stop_codon:yes gene_type:complete